MWIVFKCWDGYESEVIEFDSKTEADIYFEEQKEITDAQMYLAKVEKSNIEE